MKWLTYISLGLLVYDIWSVNQNLKNGADGFTVLLLIPALLFFAYSLFAVKYVVKRNTIDSSISKWVLILLPVFLNILAHMLVFFFMALHIATPKFY